MTKHIGSVEDSQVSKEERIDDGRIYKTMPMLMDDYPLICYQVSASEIMIVNFSQSEP